MIASLEGFAGTSRAHRCGGSGALAGHSGLWTVLYVCVSVCMSACMFFLDVCYLSVYMCACVEVFVPFSCAWKSFFWSVFPFTLLFFSSISV